MDCKIVGLDNEFKASVMPSARPMPKYKQAVLQTAEGMVYAYRITEDGPFKNAKNGDWITDMIEQTDKENNVKICNSRYDSAIDGLPLVRPRRLHKSKLIKY